MLKFGVLGFAEGYYAVWYTREMAKMKEVEVTALCDLGQPPEYIRQCADIDIHDFAKEVGGTLFHDVDEFLGADIDMVLVTSESHDHCRHALKALAAGKHVLLAKPAVLRADEMKQIIQAVNGSNLIVLPGEPARYDSNLKEVAYKVRSGEVGRIVATRVFVNHFAMTNHEWEKDVHRSGGPLAEFGAYASDILIWTTDTKPVSLVAYGDNFVHKEINAEDNIKVIAKNEDGSLASLDICCSIHWPYPMYEVEVIGTDGAIRTNFHDYGVWVHRADVVRLKGPRISPIGGSTLHLNVREARHFVNCVRGLEKPCISLEEAYYTAKVLDAIRESLAKRKEVEICYE